MKISLLSAVAVSTVVFCTSVTATPIVSDFSSDVDGWKTRDYFSGLLRPTIAWDGAAITTTDTADLVVFSAPGPKFTGDKSTYYGGAITFDLFANAVSTNTRDDFALAIGTGSPILPGSSTVLHWFGGQPSTSDFRTFTIGLSELDLGWRIGSGPTGGGRAPTEGEFRSLLADVRWLYILADWYDGPDFVRLDNVRITEPVPSVPPPPVPPPSVVSLPSTLLLLIPGIIVGGLIRKTVKNGEIGQT